ncbi:hypothetical protein HDU96_002644 [Phlyctochytrium bullatum]|nr:hypothetical protein HDU96_002644 [Phlyctochytrium bullatum]
MERNMDDANQLNRLSLAQQALLSGASSFASSAGAESNGGSLSRLKHAATLPASFGSDMKELPSESGPFSYGIMQDPTLDEDPEEVDEDDEMSDPEAEGPSGPDISGEQLGRTVGYDEDDTIEGSNSGRLPGSTRAPSEQPRSGCQDLEFLAADKPGGTVLDVEDMNSNEERITGAYCRWAILLALVQAITISLLQAGMFTLVLRFAYMAFDNFADRTSLLFIVVHVGLFIFAQIFFVFLVYDSSCRKNTIQAIASAFFNLLLLLYSCMQVKQLSDLLNGEIDDDTGLNVKVISEGLVRKELFHIRAALITSGVMCGLMAVSLGVCAFVTFKVYQEIGWSIFQVHGASLEKRRMLRHFHFFIMLLKINIFFNVGIVVQAGAAIYFSSLANSNTPDAFQIRQAAAWSAGAGLFVVASIYYHLGASAARRASHVLMACFLFMVIANVCGLIAGLVIVHKSSKFLFARWDLTWFILIQLLLNAATFASAFILYRDFSKGLRDILAVNSSKFLQSSPSLHTITSCPPTLAGTSAGGSGQSPVTPRTASTRWPSLRRAPQENVGAGANVSSASPEMGAANQAGHIAVLKGSPGSAAGRRTLQHAFTFGGPVGVPAKSAPLQPRSVPVLD